MRPILQYIDLINIQVIESNEPLCVVQTVVPEITCIYEKPDMAKYLGEQFVLRDGTVKRLKLAAKDLRGRNPNYRLRLTYGYRHPDIQRVYLEKRKREVIERFPDLTKQELIAKTHLLTASPDVAGHPTGGAIDITITDPNEILDMGGRIADFSNACIETFAPGLTDEQTANRALLRDILMQQEFAPFDGEWWHFSYGDREWAAYYGKPNAIYDQIAYGNKKKSRFPSD
mgnify:CR=1 FL=1